MAVACLDSQRKANLLEQVCRFNGFTPDNDPHGEHDFGAIDLGAVTYIFKRLLRSIANRGFARSGRLGVTHRVLTITRADEY